MTAKHPTFIVRNGEGSRYLFRSIIPRDLRQKVNNAKELRISLKTGLKSEAKRLAYSLKIQLDRIFNDIRYGNISETCVISIKNELREHLDGLQFQNNKGFGDCTKNDGISPPPFWAPPPQKTSFEEAMKLPPDYKLVKEYVSKFKFGDIIKYCEDNDLEFDKDYFPRRHIRRCRENLIKLIDQEIGLDQVARDFAQNIIRNYLLSQEYEGFRQFFTRFGISTKEITEYFRNPDQLDISAIVQRIGEDWDLIEIAQKLGVKYIEREDDNIEEDEPGTDEEKEDTLKKVWDNLKTVEKTTEEVQETITPNTTCHRQSETLPPQSAQPALKAGPLISVVAEEYYEEMKAAQVWSPKSEMEKRSAIGRFVEIVGDIGVDKLSHEVARKYKRTLMKLPSNMRKDPRYRDLSIKEILKLGDVKPIAINTVNNNISTVVALMTWARKNGYVPENYFEGLKVPSKKKAQDERKPFSTRDINRIFKSDLYLKETINSPARYWILLLDLYTGARLNELCQLHVTDIIKEDGLWCIDINDKNDDPADKDNPKKLKNQASERVIPIHPKLIDLGFIKFVRKQKKSKTVRLFPELNLRIDGFSRKVGRWFNESYLRKKVGIKDPEKTFHSFRHTVADVLKQKGILESYISEYLGHSSGDSETFGRYGKQYRPRVLMEEVVERIRYKVDFKVFEK